MLAAPWMKERVGSAGAMMYDVKIEAAALICVNLSTLRTQGASSLRPAREGRLTFTYQHWPQIRGVREPDYPLP
jgi:hypothetical protein